jgi:DNA helicase II / ATP-dependent DNA helicase PcrA
LPLHEALKLILVRTGYLEMLEQENTPESQARVENLKELVNAAAEAVERGEGPTEFLDRAALVADSDALDEQAQVSLMTLHNAKGLEFPIVFLAGLEEGLFPHSRSIDSPSMIEEERRLCYVGMTRAEKRLFLSWARSRRRFGGGQQERTMRSRFLAEVPGPLIEGYVEDFPATQVDLTAERSEVREAVKKNTYTGKTYNSLENISQFFAERGIKAGGPAPVYPPRKVVGPAPVAPTSRPQAPRKAGSTVDHPKYGRGVIVRREGEGEEAKLTVSFPKYGLKKLIEQYAGLNKD